MTKLSPAERAEIKLAALADIRDHLVKHGSKDWATTRVKYPTISETQWWNLVAAVKGGLPDETILASTIKQQKAILRRHLPVAPNSQYLAETGEVAVKSKLNFVEMFDELLDDVDMLRAFSITHDANTGEEKVRNPMFFSQSITLKQKLIESSMRIAKDMADIQRQQRFWEAVIDEIGLESPACRDRIIERVERLNREYGMTAHAGGK